MEILRAENLTKIYGTGENQVVALDHVSFSVNKGEFLAIIGPSGSGKSTLLNLIAGLEKPTEGKILLNGKEVKAPGSERTVMFQEHALFPWLNVIQNIKFGMKINGVPKEEQEIRAEKYLKMMQLEQYKDYAIHQLSGGMRQRVALARAFTMDSDILLMDEPFSALDMQNRHMLQEQLIGVWKRFKNTIVFVTHDVDEAIYLADKIVIMDKNPGKIKEVFDVDMPRLRKRESEEFIKIQEEVLDKLNVEDF